MISRSIVLASAVLVLGCTEVPAADDAGRTRDSGSTEDGGAIDGGAVDSGSVEASNIFVPGSRACAASERTDEPGM